MEEWIHDGLIYKITSTYLLPEDAWTYELTGPYGTSGSVARFAVVIPDTTPDGEQFTPADATRAFVAAGGRPMPWPLLLRFLRSVETSGDVVPKAPTAAVTGDLSLSLNSWRFGDRVFEVTSYHYGDRDSWCYELYEVDPSSTSNAYIDVLIPDLEPADGPFMPAPAPQVAVTGHGSPELPWPVVRHFLDAVAAGGNIVDDQAA